ncbi:MAG TPA: hypothetical protein EYO76_09410 [Flavobacteriaceae bacterium]|nr:hypothetical protein [Flavobacteriaceae bacterium]
MNKKQLSYIALVVITILSIPFITMQFTSEVNWSTFDFIIASILLFGFITLAVYSIKSIKNPKIRIGLILGIIILFLLIWTELAVGIFNSPFAGS